MENQNYKNLNDMVDYIENNLINKIDISELATIVGISANSLQRIFNFLTGITIIEYIKKRRLSKAYEEIKHTNTNIFDIAIKYQYNSTIAFDRAFKREFGITPMECRQRKLIYQQFPILIFKNDEQYKMLDYQIKDMPEIEIYYYQTETSRKEDYLYKIRELYDYLKEKKIHEKLKKEEQYAISSYDGKNHSYIVGSKTKYTSNYKMKIPSGKYAIFEVGTREQKDIINMEKNIYGKWLKSTNIDINNNFSLEYYKGDNCYLCFLIVNE